ncbi:MAG: DUF3396 domain-containing protein [Azoarcus sp.]|jgi:hypothetical protein|nr:DUF3396 domain-containing protein [Azoarcus sp.]
MFGVFSPAGWFEQIHKPMTVIRFYLPIEELRGEGKQKFEQLLLQFCQILRPLHGAAGLGIQECQPWRLDGQGSAEHGDAVGELAVGVFLGVFLGQATWRLAIQAGRTLRWQALGQAGVRPSLLSLAFLPNHAKGVSGGH